MEPFTITALLIALSLMGIVFLINLCLYLYNYDEDS